MNIGHRFIPVGRLDTSTLDRYKILGKLTVHDSCVWWALVNSPSVIDRLEEGRLGLGNFLRFNRNFYDDFMKDKLDWSSFTSRSLSTSLAWAWFRSGGRKATVVVFPSRRGLETALRDCEVLVVMES